MRRIGMVLAALAIATLCDGTTAQATTDAEGLQRFREIYKELVETNTTLSAGDCTLAAQRMAARLKAAGYSDGDLRVFVPEGHPKEGGLLAVLHGSDSKAKAILMLAHVDVVEAKREDWTRDPFTLIEEDGYFYRFRSTNRTLASWDFAPWGRANCRNESRPQRASTAAADAGV
jgi:hypothetical protein